MTIQTHRPAQEAEAVAAAQKATKAGLASIVEHLARLGLSPTAVVPYKPSTCGYHFLFPWTDRDDIEFGFQEIRVYKGGQKLRRYDFHEHFLVLIDGKKIQPEERHVSH